MLSGRSKRVSLFLFFALFSVPTAGPAGAETFFNKVQTGFVELRDLRNPIFLYVPSDYEPTRSYSLIVLLPGGGSLEDATRRWSAAAGSERIIMVPELKLRSGELPYQTDDWLLKAKNEVAGRYQVPRGRVLLIGEGEGAEYAAYLGLKYPKEFRAVGLVGRGWNPSYDKLVRLSGRPARQVPFYVALPEGESKIVESVQSRAGRLKQKGYPVTVKLESEDGLGSEEFRAELVAGLEESGASWSETTTKRRESLGEKIRAGIENLF